MAAAEKERERPLERNRKGEKEWVMDGGLVTERRRFGENEE